MPSTTMKAKIDRIVTHAPHLVARKRSFGLGDIVAAVAQPIARAVDKVTGSKLTSCVPCKQRQAALNSFVPNVTKPFSRK